ncbi:hypothetical protein B0H14DRAFT_2715708, partial [Mycena olivaceomarginata]
MSVAAMLPPTAAAIMGPLEGGDVGCLIKSLSVFRMLWGKGIWRGSTPRLRGEDACFFAGDGVCGNKLGLCDNH